jgi:hypothetical protein
MLKQLVVRQILKDAVAYNKTDRNCSNDGDCSDLGGAFVCSTASPGKCEAINLQAHPAYSRAYEYDYEGEVFYMNEDDPTIPRFVESNWLPIDLQFVTFPRYWTGRISVGVGIFLWGFCALVYGRFWSSNLAHLKAN